MIYPECPTYITADCRGTTAICRKFLKNSIEKFEIKKSKKVLDKYTQPVYNEPRR